MLTALTLRVVLAAAMLSLAPACNAQQSPAAAPAAPGAPEKHILCEHAAPPRGSHWVCDHPQNPCQCHLESDIPGRPIFGEGSGQPWPTVPAEEKAAGAAACKKVAVNHFVAPFYPETARLGVQGSVTLYAKLDPDGHVTNVIPEGTEAFYSSALGTLRQWTFHNSAKVKAVVVVFNYVLQQKALTTDTPATEVTAELPCRVEISTTPEMPPSYQRY